MSTRGAAPVLDFVDVMLTGLASDGGLYVPESWPALPSVSAEAPYADTATEVIWPYVDGVSRTELAAAAVEAYATFDHPAVCPLVELGPNTWLLELFHGPTLAFKDVALQLLARLLDAELERRGERIAIVLATSGDTGSAAIEACRSRPNIDIFVFHPEGRVSEVQRRQMTTVTSSNVHNVALAGTFDDCQDMVKALFADAAFRDRFRLGAANSINWGRVVPQIVYYVTSGLALGTTATRPVSFAVPTGNFGNVLSGWVAKEMGLPVGSADHRLEPQRHPHPRGRDGFDAGHRGRADDEPEHGHPGVVELRAIAVRAQWAGRWHDGGADEPVSVARAACRSRPTRQSGCGATFDAARCDEDGRFARWLACTQSRAWWSPARGGACPPQQTRRDPGRPGGGACHCAPREVPRRSGACNRRSPRVARSARRADGPA